MLIVFKAKRCTDVTMLEDSGREILGLLGKDRAADRGIVTVAQIPAAIDSLTSATRQPRLAQPDARPRDTSDPEFDAREDRVRLFQRVQPVKALLSQALRCGTPMTWGV